MLDSVEIDGCPRFVISGEVLGHDTHEILSNYWLTKPRLGNSFVIGVWPPSNPGFIPAPERDF